MVGGTCGKSPARRRVVPLVTLPRAVSFRDTWSKARDDRVPAAGQRRPRARPPRPGPGRAADGSGSFRRAMPSATFRSARGSARTRWQTRSTGGRRPLLGLRPAAVHQLPTQVTSWSGVLRTPREHRPGRRREEPADWQRAQAGGRPLGAPEPVRSHAAARRRQAVHPVPAPEPVRLGDRFPACPRTVSHDETAEEGDVRRVQPRRQPPGRRKGRGRAPGRPPHRAPPGATAPSAAAPAQRRPRRRPPGGRARPTRQAPASGRDPATP
ncbi:hypothetical protein SUDANB19_04477 [Streptomyces sp. enrichment culture]